MALILLSGKRSPWPVAIFLAGLVAYQLYTGKLLKLTTGVWCTRQERPSLYWRVVLIEAAVAILYAVIGLL
jgi:hypothetical protein